MSAGLLSRRSMLGRSALALGSALAVARDLTGPQAAAAEPGPAASGSLATVGFAATTGRFAPAALWGFATAALCDRNFGLCEDARFVGAAASLNMALLRLNSTAGAGSTGSGYWTDAVFRNGANNPDWSVMAAFMNAAHTFINPTCRLILGIKFNGTFAKPSDYAAACRQLAIHLKNTPSGDRPLPVWGFEVDNETNSRLDIGTYCSFFNAAADALHAVDPDYKVIGPVDSYVDPGRLNTFASNCGSRVGRICYHNYRYCQGSDSTPLDDELFQSRRPARDARDARRALARTPAANVPLMMGEWNMECAAGNEPREQEVVAAPFSAYWMLSGFLSGAGVDCGAVWELVNDGFYGAIQDGRVDPAGRLLSTAGQTMEGNQVACDFAGNGAISLATTRDGGFGVMLVNYGSATRAGTVGLSHWPVNPTGNGTIRRWEISHAFPRGNLSALPVAGGVTSPTTVPPRSVVILTTEAVR
jgi:Glycosyl hydrolases family 39